MSQKEKILAKAQKFLEKGNIDKAAAEYKAVVAIDPADVMVRLRLGDLYAKLNSKDEAIKEYTEVAKIHTTKGFYLKAIAVYKQILKLDEFSLEVHNKLADLYTKQRLIADAITEFSYIVNTYEKKGRTNDAFDLVKKMVSLDPENMGVKLRLADMHLKLGYGKDARVEYKWVYDKLMSQGKFDKAEKIYLELYKLNPRDADITEGLIEVYRKLGNKREFLEYSHALLNIYSDDSEKQKAVCESILSVVPTDEKAMGILGEGKPRTTSVTKEYKSTDNSVPEVVLGKAPEPAPETKPFLAAPSSTPSPSEPLVEFPSIGVPAGKPKEEPLIDFPLVGVSGAESAKEEEPVIEFPKVEEVLDDIELSFESPVEEIYAVSEEKEEPQAAAPSAEKEAAMTSESEEFFEINIEPPVEEEIALEVEEPEAEVMPEVMVETAESPYSYEKQPGEAESPAMRPEDEDVGLSGLFAGSGMGGLQDVSAALNEGEEVPADTSIDSGYVDLSKEFGLDEALDKLVGSWSGGEKQETFEEFKAGVGEQLGREDVETHYNLGIAYMEMELFDDAIREFKVSLKSPALEFDAYTRLVHCAMGAGALDEAVSYGLKALKVKGRSDDERKGVMYELGLAYEAAGKTIEAKDMYQSVMDIDPTFREVTDKMEELDAGKRPVPPIPMEDDGLLEVELL